MKRAFDVKEAANYLGTSVSTIRQLRRDNKLPARRMGTKVLFDVADLDALFESLPEAS